MKIKKLIKTFEFLFVVGFALVAWLIGWLGLIPAIILGGGYMTLNLMGWANKTVNPDPDKP